MWEKGKTCEAGDAGGGAVSIMNSQIPQASDSTRHPLSHVDQCD
jgi:hypothetical protein